MGVWVRKCARASVRSLAVLKAAEAALGLRRHRRDDASAHTASSVQPYSSALRCDAALIDPSLNSTAAPSRSGNSLPRPSANAYCAGYRVARDSVSRGISCRSRSTAPAARECGGHYERKRPHAREGLQPRAFPPACASPRARASACAACVRCALFRTVTAQRGRTSRSCRLRRRTPRRRTAAAAAATARMSRAACRVVIAGCTLHDVRCMLHGA